MGAQRPEDLDDLRDVRRLAVRPVPHERDRAQACRHLAELRRRGRNTDPIVRQRVAQAWIGLQVNRYNNYRALTSLMRRGELGPESSFSKLFWANWHRDFGALTVDLLGADELV